METYHVVTTVADDGTITIKALPFRAGERVKVSVRSQDGESTSAGRYPLRGKPIRYEDPLAGVAESDWNVLQ